MGRGRASKGKREHWRRLIAEAAQSGTSIREFCRRRGVTERQFYSWRTKLNGQVHGAARRQALAATGQTGTFALVSDAPGALEAGIELLLADGRRLRISRGVDEATLRTVLAALQAASSARPGPRC
jgi:transposase-like protein